jgi:hypothetical protein
MFASGDEDLSTVALLRHAAAGRDCLYQPNGTGGDQACSPKGWCHDVPRGCPEH